MRPIPPDTTGFSFGRRERERRSGIYTHTTNGTWRADWNYGGKDRRFPMTVMIMLRRKGVNRISKGCASRTALKSEPPNTIITPPGHVYVWIFTKIEIGYCKNKLHRIAISTATLMIPLGTPETLATRHIAATARNLYLILIDRSMTGQATARAKIPIFREIAAPALNDLATCWMRNGEWLSVVKWFGRAREREHDAAVGLTCCNHQTEKSSNRLLRRGATHRVASRPTDKFVFIQTISRSLSLFTTLTHNSVTTSHRLKLTYPMHLRFGKHQHSFSYKYSCSLYFDHRKNLTATWKSFR